METLFTIFLFLGIIALIVTVFLRTARLSLRIFSGVAVLGLLYLIFKTFFA